MPAWMTPLLCVLVSRPGRGWRSSTHTDRPRAAIARADARPVTPAPMTATSIRVTFFHWRWGIHTQREVSLTPRRGLLFSRSRGPSPARPRCGAQRLALLARAAGAVRGEAWPQARLHWRWGIHTQREVSLTPR